MTVLPTNLDHRALFLIFGPFDPSVPPEETPMGRARYHAGHAQKLFADFDKKVKEIETIYPSPSPRRPEELRLVLHSFERNLNPVESAFASEVKGPRDLLQQEVSKQPIIGATDAAQAVREIDSLAFIERTEGGHLARQALVWEGIRSGDELLYLAILGAGIVRQRRILGGGNVDIEPVLEKMRERWFDSKADPTKKALLAKLNVVIKQVEELFKKLRRDAQARAGVAPSPEEEIKARLITSRNREAR